MEFHHLGVAVYFRLLLQALQAGVEIHYITFARELGGTRREYARLVEAIADARLTPIPSIAARLDLLASDACRRRTRAWHDGRKLRTRLTV